MATMETMEVQVRSLRGQTTVIVPKDATVGQVRAAAEAQGISTKGLSIRSGGATVQDKQPVRDSEVLVATPPNAKQGC